MSHLSALLLLAACGSPSGLPTATLTVAGHPVTAEIATTSAQKSKGLMMRDHLGADDAMLFVYPDDRIREFWMKDTRIPLSIAYLDKTGKIVKIADMHPFDESRTSSIYPARYALEVNVGWFAAHGVEKGSVVEGIPAGLTAE